MSTIQSRTPEKKAKNPVRLTWKFPWKSCSTTHLPFLSSNSKILKAFLKTFPPKWSLINAQQKKKKWGRKSEKREEDRKLSAHTRTSQSNIFHQDQKAAKCATWTWLYGKFVRFQLFIARQWPENRSLSFKTHFLAKFLGANGLRHLTNFGFEIGRLCLSRK